MNRIPRILVLAACSLALHAATLPPDLILTNGKIWTSNPAQPVVEALASRADRIVAAGTKAEIMSLAGPQTQVLDLHGKLLVPGFIDAGVHLIEGGMHLYQAHVGPARNAEELRRRVRSLAAGLPDGRWLVSTDWDDSNWPRNAQPTREILDAVTGSHPAVIVTVDGRMALANTLALRLASLTGKPGPSGDGGLYLDAHGEPTGLLIGAWIQLVERVIPAPCPEEVEDFVRLAIRHAAENGVTSVQDQSLLPYYGQIYRKLAAQGELSLRISKYESLVAWNAPVIAPAPGPRGVLGFADGTLALSTALFFGNYADQPAAGLAHAQMTPEGKMRQRILDADQAGHQVAIHAVGDKAAHQILDFFEAATVRNGEYDRRFRLDEARFLTPADVTRMGRLGVVASVQPWRDIADEGRWTEARVGHDRSSRAAPYRSLLDAGAVLAFSSGWGAAPLNPLLGVYAAVTRRALDSRNSEPWLPEQRITVEEAMRACSAGPAWGAFEDKDKGSLEPGKLADFAVLSDDVFTLQPDRLRDVKVMLTIVGGRVIFDRAIGYMPLSGPVPSI